VVVAYGQILRREVLELPRLGCVNIHSSLLPRWRGAAPIQWAILEGDSETGVTTMRLVEKLDAGEILLQARTQIGHEDSAGTLHDRLSRMGAELVIPTLDGLERGTINGLTQDESKVTYASKLSKDMEWLAPALGAEALERRIQALNPWPGTSVRVAFAGVEPRRLRIRGAKARPDIQGQVGQIFEKAGMVLFGTASGALELLSFQWDGKREVDAAGFLHGLRGRGIMLPLETVFELPRSVGS
jgi:methionyl-tRNA formyltransferase